MQKKYLGAIRLSSMTRMKRSAKNESSSKKKISKESHKSHRTEDESFMFIHS